MDNMKKEVQQYEEELRSRHQALAKERDRLAQFRPGSDNYETLERSLADKAAKLQSGHAAQEEGVLAARIEGLLSSLRASLKRRAGICRPSRDRPRVALQR